jgi:hypothetical protein
VTPGTTRSDGRRGPNAYQARKIAQGVRAARRETCRTCGADVFVGYDARVLALLARVEVYAANAVDEVLARGNGRASYDVTRYDGVVEIDRRDVWTVRARPGSPTLGGAVHLAHDCHEAARPEPDPPAALFDVDGPPPY